MMEDSINDYVFIDGVHLLKDKLLIMARKVGIPNIAEHYLYFLTHHALTYKMNDLIETFDKENNHNLNYFYLQENKENFIKKII